MLKDLNEIFADGRAAVITVAGPVERELACGSANRCCLDTADQLFGTFDQRISMNLGLRGLGRDLKRALKGLSKGAILVERIRRYVH